MQVYSNGLARGALCRGVAAVPGAVRGGRGFLRSALIGGCALIALGALSGCKSLLHSDESIKAYEARSALDAAGDSARGRKDERAAAAPSAPTARETATPTVTAPQAGEDALALSAPQGASEGKPVKTRRPANETAQVVAEARAAAQARKAQQKAEKARLAQLRRSEAARAKNNIYVGAKGLKGRKLLQASVDQAFAALRASGGFWNGASRLPLPVSLAGSLAVRGQDEALQRAINQVAYAAALSMEPFLAEAAEEVPMKYGQEKFKGQMPVTDFVHRTLGSASVNTLQERIYTALTASRDPAVMGCLKTLDTGARAALAAQIADATDAAIWQRVRRSEFALEGRGA
ncbi:DUF4197 family protein [Novosphingobium sp. 1949]|uniref:DUF4197 family protein n=1 Tax=Novosphingobium organovorum TaxID=2930092 RepID=A0ABT0B825_9SPHN|nr:DUF4197 family protein [Novosphingobium organovorum]MCJ2181187.1 DUF4197 family protein [Novosphingobium organovorum]